MAEGYKTVGTSSIVLLDPAARRRRRVVFVNTGSYNVTIARSSPAVANNGIVLVPNGSASDEPDPTGYMYQGAYFAVGAGAGNVVTYSVDDA